MAGPENMAEVTGINAFEAPPPPKTPEDPLLSTLDQERIRREAANKGASVFAMAEATFNHYSGGIFNGVPIENLPPDTQTELQNRRLASKTELVRLRDEAELRVGGRSVLEHARGAALEFLKRVRAARSQERHGGSDRGEVIRRGRHEYEEVVFDDSAELKELQSVIGRLPSYIYEGIVQEVDKEANRRPSPPLNPLAAEEYTEIKRRRERGRPREKKYTETPAYWGGRYYELLWPESSRDMIASILDFVKDRISEIGNRDVGTIHELLQDIRRKTVELLETCRVRLNSDEWFRAENKEITESDPNFLRARAFGEGVDDVIGNEKVMYKGNIEYGPQYKERFASEFIAHHDEIYLAPKVAYTMHKLKKVRDGTYWLGHGWNVEKAEEGEIADYRREIEEEILEDAATHDIFLNDDMTRGLYVNANGNPILGKDGRPIGAFEYREGGNPDKRDLRFSFDDNIEALLLDSGDQIRQRIAATGDAEALRRHYIRVKFFRDTKDRLDAEQGLVGLTPEQRQQKIRFRIWQKMQQKTHLSYIAQMTRETMAKLADARASNIMEEYDRILWQWVKDYNEHRISYRLPRWYPTSWDRVRWNIDRPTKVLDRALSEEEFEAMFEPVRQDQTLDEDTIRQHKEDARFGFQLARGYQIFQMQDILLGGMRARLIDPKTGKYCGRLPDDETSLALGLIRQVGTDAQGKPMYEVVDPNRKMVRVFDVVQARLEMAIAKEAEVIEQAKAELAAAEKANDQQLIREKKDKLRDIFVNSQFVATHALKEIGLVEGKLPVWSYNFLDRSTIYVFTEVLARYGVEEDVGVPISHNSKKAFYEYMERGRRALKAEYDRAAQEFMTGTYPVFERDLDGIILTRRKADGSEELDASGNPIPIRAISLFSAASDWGEPGEMSERFRVVSKGAVKEDTQVTEAMFDISTSGGVIFIEAIPFMGDFGFYPMLLWLGVTDIRQLHGYIKRRDEVEYHRHKFFDVLDPIHNAKAQAAAYIARRALMGGVLTPEINGQQPTPGFLMEPFHAAFKSADWLQKQRELARTYRMDNTDRYLALMQAFRQSSKGYSQFLESGSLEFQFTKSDGTVVKENLTGKDLDRFGQMAYLDLDRLDKSRQDEFYQTMYGILDYFQWALKATKEIETNRIGNAPRNWVEGNTLKWYRFRREMRKALQRPDPEKGFIIRHGYSPEVASEISIRMMEAVLADADYLILRDYERERRAMDGAQILSRALTTEARQRGFVIPDESEWSAQPEGIRLALENIRRRGLLEFMREEGYKTYYVDDNGNMRFSEDKNGKIKIGDKTYRADRNGKFIQLKEVLGRKIPPLVQEVKVKENNNRVKSW